MAENASNIKPNDLFLNLMNNPMYRTVDFMDVGLNADNTTILPAEKYKANEKVKSNPLFQTDGKFDETKFNQVYNTSVMMFNEMTQTSFDEQVAKEIEYQPGSLFAVHEDNPTFTDGSNQSRIVAFGKDVEANPDRNRYNTSEIGRISLGQWTPQELAQMHQTYNRETGEWEDSPETWFGDNWFSKFWNPPVMATYDETDPEVINGERQVGEYKLNPDGTYYAERLTGQPMYNKETISMWDTLTKEGSWLNRYDFFDSDDKEKSVIGSMFKNAAIILPAFISGVGTYYIGASLGLQAAKLATVGARMLGGGTDSSFLNHTENWLNQFGMNVSQHSKENAFTIENFLGLAGDVFMQLKQQRWLFKQAPKLFGFKTDITDKSAADDLFEQYKKTRLSELNKRFPNGMGVVGETDRVGDQIAFSAYNRAMLDLDVYRKGFQKTGSIISKAYMTGITTMDSYNQAKQEGASDTQAAMLALGYSIGEYAILNTSIGEMVMPELRLDKQMLKKSIEMGFRFEKEMKEQGATAAAKRNFLKKMIDLGKGLAEGRWHGSQTAGAIAANALGEGIEETSEEVLFDLTKSLYNAYYWLTGDKQRYTAWNDMGTRYSMSFLGGLMGGGLFAGTETFHNFGPNGPLANMTNESAQQHLIYLIREGKRSEIERQMNKMTFGDKNLSASQLLGSDESAGFAPGTAIDNMDKAIKDTFRKVMDSWEGILDGAGIKLSDDAIIDNNMLGELRYNALMQSTSAGIFLSDYNKAVSDYMTAYREYQEASNLMQTGNKDKKPASDSSKALNDNEVTQAALAEKRQALLDALDNVKSYTDGRRSDELILRGVFETNPYLHGIFKSMSFESWLQAKRGVDTDSLSKDELQKELEEYNAYYAANGKDDLRQNFKMFLDIFRRTNPSLTKDMQDFYESSKASESVKALIKQLEYDNAQLLNALHRGQTGDTGLYDYIVRTVANPSRISRASDGLEGSDLTYAPYLEGNKNPTLEMDAYVNEAVSKLGDGVDEVIVNKVKNDAALEWYKGFVGHYTSSIVRVLNDFSKAKYVDPETKRQITGLYETYKNIIKNINYDQNAAQGMRDFIKGFRTEQDVLEDNYINYDDVDPSVFAKKVSKDDINDIFSFMAYLNLEVSNISKIIDSAVVDEDKRTIITQKEITDISNKLSEIESAFTPYAKEDANLFANVNTLIIWLRGRLQAASEFNEFYNADEYAKFGDMVEEITKKPMTPIFSSLDTFYVIGSRKPSDVIKDIEESFKSASTSPSGFSLTSEQEAHLATVLSQIQMMKSIVYASRNDNGSLSNPEGFANLTNKMMQGKDGYTPANVIDGRFAEMVNTDLERTEARLNMIAALSSFNSTRKLEGHRKMFLNRSAIIYRMIDNFKKMNPTAVDFSELEEVSKDPDMVLLKNLATAEKPNFNMTDDEYVKVFNMTNKIERAIHNAFKGHEDDVELMKSIVGKMELLQPIKDIFNLDTKEMDPNSFAWYLASIIANDPIAVNKVLEKAYTKKDIAPMPAQEMAIRGVLSFLTGRKVYHTMAKAYKASILEEVEKMARDGKLDELTDKMAKLNNDISPYVKAYKDFESRGDTNGMRDSLARIKFFVSNSDSFNVFDSIYAIAGIPGAGKTDGTIIPVLRALGAIGEEGKSMIENADTLLENVYFATTTSNANDASDDSISSRIKRELTSIKKGKVQVMDHENLMIDLFGKDGADNIHKDISADLSNDGDFIAHSGVRTNKTKRSEWPSMIIVDEALTLDQFEADAINTFAKEHNIPVIFLGDDQQTAKPTPIAEGDLKGTINKNPIDILEKGSRMKFGLSEAQFMRSPKLGMSMRTNNSQKTTNMDKYRLALPSLFRDGKNAIEFHYYNSGSAFYGDIAAASFDDNIKNAVETMIADSKDGKIGYIYNKDGALFKYLVDKGLVTVKPDGTVESDTFIPYRSAYDTQGRELKYYIFEKGTGVYEDERDVYRDLYVAMSRSKQGTVIVGDYTGTALRLTSKADASTSISTYDKKAIENFTNKYLDMMAKLNKDAESEALSIEPPIYESGSEPKLPKSDTDEGEDSSEPELPSTGVPDVDDKELVPTGESTESDTGDGAVPPPPPTDIPTGPVMSDGALVKTVIVPDVTSDGTEGTREDDEYNKAISEANDTKETKGFSNDETQSDKAFVFNVFEIGEGVDFNGDTIRYTPGAIDSSNGLIRTIQAVIGIDSSFFGDGTFDVIKFVKSNRGIDVTTGWAEKLFQITLSNLHNGFINGRTEIDRINNVKNAISSFFTSLMGEKFNDAMKSKLDSLFSVNNAVYGIKKMMKEEDENSSRIKNVNGVIRNNALFGDKANNTTNRLKFVMIIGEGDVDVPNSSGGIRTANAALLELPVFTPPNVITSFLDNKAFQEALAKEASFTYKRDGKLDVVISANDIANMFFYGFNYSGISIEPGKWQQRAAQRYLENLASNSTDVGVKYAADYYAKMLNIYSLTTTGFIEFVNNEWDNSRDVFNKMLDTAEVSGPVIYSMPAGHKYMTNGGYVLDPTEHTLSDIADSPHYTMSSIMTSMKNNEKYGLKAKLPFVILMSNSDVSIDGNKIDSNKMFEIYKNEIDNGIKRRTTKLVYVNPPRVSIAEYMGKLYNILTNKLTSKDRIIGNSFSSYRILYNLFISADETLNEDLIKNIIEDIGAIDLNITIDGNSTTLSKYIYEVLSEIQNVSDNSIKLRNKLIDEKMNITLNGILFMLTTKGDVSGGIGDINEAVIDKIESKLSASGFKGVFLFPKVSYDAEGISEVSFEKKGNDEYTMYIDDEPYHFTVFGKLDSPVLNMSYADILDRINMLNPNSGGTEIFRYYSMIEGGRPKGESTPPLDTKTPPSVTIDESLNSINQSVRDKMNNRDDINSIISSALDNGFLVFTDDGGNSWSGLDISDIKMTLDERQAFEKEWKDLITNIKPTTKMNRKIKINKHNTLTVAIDESGNNFNLEHDSDADSGKYAIDYENTIEHFKLVIEDGGDFHEYYSDFSNAIAKIISELPKEDNKNKKLEILEKIKNAIISKYKDSDGDSYSGLSAIKIVMNLNGDGPHTNLYHIAEDLLRDEGICLS